MQFLRTTIKVLNTLLLGFGPLAVFVILAMRTDGFSQQPWWAWGIFLSWAFSINLWVALAAMFKEKYRAVNQFSFFVFNFVAPIAMAWLVEGALEQKIFEISSYHFLALGLAIFGVMFCKVFDRKESAKLWERIIAAVLFTYILTLPAIWVETMNFSAVETWDAIRYIAILGESYFVFKLLEKEVSF